MILKNRQSRESDLLCSRDRQPRDWSICVTLAYREYSLRVQAWQYYFLVQGLQTDDEYSTNGRTRVLYGISLNSGFLDLMFLLRKPTDRLAEVVTF